MARIVASIAILVNAAIISAAKVRHYERKELPRCLVPLPRKWRPAGHVFLASSCLAPIKKNLLYLVENKGRLLIEQIRLLCLVIEFVRDRYARAKRREGCWRKKIQKKFKKATNKRNLMANMIRHTIQR